MKKTITIILLVCLMTLQASAQKSELIQGKWKFKDIADKEKLDVTILKQANTLFNKMEIEFAPDGHISYNPLGDNPYSLFKGKWTLNNEGNKVTVVLIHPSSGDRKTFEWEIKGLTDKELKLNMGNAVIVFGRPKVELNSSVAKENKTTKSGALPLFTLSDSTRRYWKSIAQPKKFYTGFVPATDYSGNVYARAESEHGFKYFFKLVNNNWEVVDKNFSEIEELLNDKNGIVYAKTRTGILKVEKDSCIRMPDDFDKTWKIVSEYDKDTGENYFKKYENGEWQKIPYPTSNKQNSKLQPICDAKGNLYVIAAKGDGINNRLFKYKNKQWTELYTVYPDKGGNEGEYNAHKIIDLQSSSSHFFVVGDTLYAVKNIKDSEKPGRTVAVFNYTGGFWEIKSMQVAYIPKKFSAATSPSQFTYSWAKHYIFEMNNRLGIQNEKGLMLVAPVFDKISAIETPAHILALNTAKEKLNSGNSNYCYELIANNDTLYVQISDYLPDTKILNGFGTKLVNSCIYCNGTGFEKDKTERVKVKGNWVEEKTTTTYGLSTTERHYDIDTKEHVNVTKTPTTTKTTGGYYEDKYETKIIPGGECKRCKGRYDKVNREIYEFDYSRRFYEKKWKIGNP